MTKEAISSSLQLAEKFHGIGDEIEIIYVGPCKSNNTKAFRSLISKAWQASFVKVSFLNGYNTVYTAMNAGIVQAESPYIYFCGDSDFPDLNNLLSCICSLYSSSSSRSRYAIVLGKVSTSSAILSARLPSIRGLKFLFERNPTHHQGIIYGKQIFKSLGMYSTDFYVLGDYHFNLRLRELVHSSPNTVEINTFNCIFCKFSGGGLSSRPRFSTYMESFACKKPYLNFYALAICYIFECFCFTVKRIRLHRYTYLC